MMTPLAERFQSSPQQQFVWNPKLSQIRIVHFVNQIAHHKSVLPAVARTIALLVRSFLPKDIESVLILDDSFERYFAQFPLDPTSNPKRLKLLGRKIGKSIVQELGVLFAEESIPLHHYCLRGRKTRSKFLQVQFHSMIPKKPPQHKVKKWRKDTPIHKVAHLICQEILGVEKWQGPSLRPYIPGNNEHQESGPQRCRPHVALVNMWANSPNKYNDYTWEWESRLRIILRSLKSRNFEVQILLPETTTLRYEDRQRWDQFVEELTVHEGSGNIGLVKVDRDLAKLVMEAGLIITHDAGLGHLAQILGHEPIVMYGNHTLHRWVCGFRRRLRLNSRLSMELFEERLESRIVASIHPRSIS